jgi:hypothetical protein
LGWYVRFSELSPRRVEPANKQANYTERHHVVKERNAANAYNKGKIDAPRLSACNACSFAKKLFFYSQKRIARVETSCYNPRRRPTVWTKGLSFVKAVNPQLWIPLLITCRYLFISLRFREETALMKAYRLLSGDGIIHKDVENVLITCARAAFLTSTRETPLPDGDS